MSIFGSRAGARLRAIPIALLLLAAVPAPSDASGRYTSVVSVPLAGAADDAAARGSAVDAAQALALERVLQRLTARRDHAALPSASGPNVAGYVESFTVLDENGGILRARITFRGDAVDQLLDALSIEHATEPGPRVVVVPVYMPSETDRMLWSGPNPWLDAWAAHAGDAALVPVVAPYGEFGDLQALSTTEAVDGDGPALASLAARYEASGTVVAIYQVQGGQAQVSLSVVALPDWTAADALTVRHGDPVSVDAIADTMAAIDRMWLERQIRPSYDGPVSVIEITAVFANLQDWIEIRHVLDDATVIERFDVPMVSGQSAAVMLRHYADLATVQAELAAAGLIMEPGAQAGLANAGLILRLAVAPPPAGQAGLAVPGPNPFAPQGATPTARPNQAPSGWPNPAPTGAAPTIPTLRYQP